MIPYNDEPRYLSRITQDGVQDVADSDTSWDANTTDAGCHMFDTHILNLFTAENVSMNPYVIYNLTGISQE